MHGVFSEARSPYRLGVNDLSAIVFGNDVKESSRESKLELVALNDPDDDGSLVVAVIEKNNTWCETLLLDQGMLCFPRNATSRDEISNISKIRQRKSPSMSI